MTGPGPGAPAAAGPIAETGSIRLRVTLALVGVSVFALVAVGLLFYGFLGRYVLEQRQSQLLTHAVAVAGQVDRLWSQARLRPVATARDLALLLNIDLATLPRGAGITIFQDGEILAAAGNTGAEGERTSPFLSAAMQLSAGGPAAATFELDSGSRLIVAAAPMTLGESSGLVMVTLATSDAVADRGGLFRVLAVSGLLAVGLAIAVGLLLGRLLTEPLKRLSGSANVMAAGSYDQAITGAYPGEVYELASGLETMRREVKRSEDSLKGFVASAAHELRTPLTSIQGFSQALLDGTAETDEQRRRSAAAIYRESGRLRRLVDALLTLSRYDSREFHPASLSVDAGGLVGEEVARLVEAGMVDPDRIRVQAGAPVTLVTDPDMLRQVVGNLLRNAVQYGGEEPIDVGVAYEEGGCAITVSNGGSPLGDEDRARVFERFYRGREALRDEGFGLGLPLVREICEVLGGSVGLLPDRERTVFRVWLPSGPGAEAGRRG